MCYANSVLRRGKGMQVKLNYMLQSADDMRRIKKQLDFCQTELVKVRLDLYDLSHLEVYLDQIKKQEQKIETNSRYCGLFEILLNRICRLYEKNENELIDYCESVISTVKRKAVTVQNLSKLGLMYQRLR